MGISGGSKKAQDQANQQAAQQQQDIKNSISGINAIYDSPDRKAQYDKLASDTTKYYTDDVNRQEAKAARQLKFAQARSGLTGGSQAAFQGKQLGQDYSQAIIDATRRGNQASSNLRASDETTRNNLIAMAESGLDAGTAANEATTSLQNNLLSSQSSATADSLGSAFGDLSSIYQNSQDQKAARQGSLYGYQGLFAPQYGQGVQTQGYSYG